VDFTNPLVTGVAFGGKASNFTVDQDDLVTAVSPAGVGIADIELTNADGSAIAGIFIYTPDVADVVFLTPASGSMQGGTDVTLTGTGFLSVSQVTFGGTPATQITINSDSEIIATSPAGQGVVDVGVFNAAGDSSTVPFTYVPLVTGVDPDSGAESGGDFVTITGEGFNSAFRVEFDGVFAVFNITSDTEITATTPAGQNAVFVTVTTADGTSPSTTDAIFTYVP
jgi:hypothetical protein